MNKLVCNYAPVRFLPYREVGEFVTVGVLVHCPQRDYFNFRLISPKRTARISNFFPELDITIFKAGLKGVALELERLRGEHGFASKEIPEDQARAQIDRFREIVRRREGLLHFGESGTILADSPEDGLEELFARFVERQFAQKREYQEVIMRKRLATFLRDWQLDHFYEINREVGDKDFHVTMPFVHYAGAQVGQVVRPLDLDKDEPSEIYQHGGAWVNNMGRLRDHKQMPPRVVFTVQFPTMDNQLRAASTICRELQALGIETVDFADQRSVRLAVQILPTK